MSSLPSDWVCLPLAEVTSSIANGFTHQNNPASGGMPISRIQTISTGEIDFELVGYAGLRLDDVTKYVLNPGDILFSHINSKEHVGKVAIYRDGMPTLIHGMNLLRIVANDKVLPAYLFWAFRTDAVRSQIWANTRHAVNQASINIRNLSTVEIPVPPLEEQVRIVEALDDHLSRLDKALAEVESGRTQEKLFKRSLLHALFENLDADVLELGEVSQPKYGKDVPKHLRGDGFTYPVVGSAGVMTYTEVPLVEEPSILVGRKGNVGAVQMFSTPCSPVDTAYYLVCPADVDLEFMFFQLQSIDLKALDSSTTIPSLRRQDLETVPFRKPGIAKQREIAEEIKSKLSSIDSALDQLSTISTAISSLRRSVLHAAFSGTLLKDAR